LRESRREKRVEALDVVAGRLRMGVKHLAEFVADGLQRRVHRSSGSQFGEPVFDDAPHKPRGMGEIRGEFFGVIRRWWIFERKRCQCPQQRIRVAVANQALGFGVRCSWIERGVRDDFNRRDRFLAPKNPQAGEIRHRPNRQGLEPLELPFVVGVAIAGRIGGFRWGLQFDEGAGRLTGAFERDVGPADARRREFGNDDQTVRGNPGQHGFEQALKRRRQSLLEVARPRPAQFANAECIFND
jgi:hypothetical protein